MAWVVCVHGVGQQLKGEDVLAGEWVPALRDGMRRADAGKAVLPELAMWGSRFTGMCSVRRDGALRWVTLG